MNEVIRVDNYEISQYLDCEQKDHYRFVEKLAPTEPSVALGFGITLHKGREVWHLSYLEGKPESEAINDGVQAIHTTWQEQLGSLPFVEDRHTVHNAEVIFRKYCERFPSTVYEPIKVEMPFVVELGTSPGGIQVEYSGVMDELCRFGGALRVLDLKTSSFFPGAVWMAQWRTAGSFMGYVWSAEKILGVEVSGMVVHGIWVRTPPKTTRGKAFDEYFRSDLISFSRESLEEWRRNVLQAVDKREEARAKGTPQLNLGSGCRFCGYKTLCSAGPMERDALKRIYYKKEEWTPLASEKTREIIE
jgi:hypothetical protein